jgi:hypothetical protein
VRPATSPKKKIHAKKSQQRIAGLINGCRQRRVLREEIENKELD